MEKEQLKVMCKDTKAEFSKYSVYKVYVAQVNDAEGISWSGKRV